ncbi:hypothetical protein GGX14DRAFT_378716, partial [Mycena pura]
GKKGPKSSSRDHFSAPAAVVTKAGTRWEFKCRHCTTVYTVLRTVPKGSKFEDEIPQPPLGNLATHLRTAHTADELREIPSNKPTIPRDLSAASAEITGKWLKEGKLNPAVRRTQAGFYKVFSASLIDRNLPWTTGEPDSIKLKVCDRILPPVAPHLRQAIDQWIFKREELRPLLLSDDDWQLLKAVASILQVFTQVTKTISVSKTPTLPFVLPMYEHMLKKLSTHSNDMKLHESLRLGAAAALIKLDTYYKKARACQFYVIATSEFTSANCIEFGIDVAQVLH